MTTALSLRMPVPTRLRLTRFGSLSSQIRSASLSCLLAICHCRESGDQALGAKYSNELGMACDELRGSDRQRMRHMHREDIPSDYAGQDGVVSGLWGERAADTLLTDAVESILWKVEGGGTSTLLDVRELSVFRGSCSLRDAGLLATRGCAADCSGTGAGEATRRTIWKGSSAVPAAAGSNDRLMDTTRCPRE